jgi:myosin heavy subunit
LQRERIISLGTQFFRPGMAAEDGIDDMIVLDQLTEENMLLNLHVRYQKNIIYVRAFVLFIAVSSLKSYRIEEFSLKQFFFIRIL